MPFGRRVLTIQRKRWLFPADRSADCFFDAVPPDAVFDTMVCRMNLDASYAIDAGIHAAQRAGVSEVPPGLSPPHEPRP